ncbi:unnamed protein product [Symbiodinium sp. CCMP2592]|nr:unnamed protein product [Symbiodinium sp. CCMP2592]
MVSDSSDAPDAPTSEDDHQESDDEDDTDAHDTTTAPADSDGEHLFADDPRLWSHAHILIVLPTGLRRVTQDFGDDWPLPTDDDSPTLSSDEPESSDIVSDTGSVAWATILIYTPLYAPEWMTLALHFPSTYEEAVAVIQEERDPAQARRFPFLTPTDPQPIPGAGVFVALAPIEQAQKTIFLDATRWDGRHFASLAPDYINPVVLRHLCDLAPGSDAAFFVGHDAQPLPEEASIHVSNGLVVIVAQVQAPLPVAVSIDVMFRRPSLWAQHFAFPPDDRVVYCVVEDQQNVHFSYQNERPTQYRHQLAAALRIPYAQLVLYPANPRVGDAVLDGMPCRTVVAAAQLPATDRHPQTFLVLLDCRPFYAGWCSFLVRQGLLNVRAVEVALSRDLPDGWSLHLPEVPPGVLYYQVTPGQVIQAEAAPPAFHSPTDAVDSAPDDPQTQPGHAEHPPSSGDASRFAPPIDHSAADHATSLDDDTGPTTSVGDLEDEFTDLPFLVLIPEYLPEVVRVRVRLPQTVHGVLARVSAARMPNAKRRFPRLLPVHTQTFPERGVLMAAPVWDVPTVLLCVDCRVDNRLFAVAAPPLFRRRDALRLAGLPDDAPVHIYFNDTPWPIGDDIVLQPALADLVLILPMNHRNFQDTAWILADELHFGLLLRPAAPWVANHMHDGEVVEVELLTHTQANLDLDRPILLQRARSHPIHPIHSRL